MVDACGIVEQSKQAMAMQCPMLRKQIHRYTGVANAIINRVCYRNNVCAAKRQRQHDTFENKRILGGSALKEENEMSIWETLIWRCATS